MPGRLSAADTARLLAGEDLPPRQKTPEQLAVTATNPKRRLSKEETDAALSASSAPPSTAKDIRQSTTNTLDPLPGPDPGALDPTSNLGATARGAVQGGTLRFGDELGAGAMMVPEAIGRAAEKVGLIQRPPAPIEGHVDQAAADAAQEKQRPSIADTYRSLRDSLRADNKTAEKTHPLEYGAAELGAGLTLPLPGSGLARGAPLAAKMGLGAAQATGAGALAGAGGSEASDIGGVLKDAAAGGALAAPFGAAGGGMSHVAEGLGPYFTNKAGERGFQAVGARAGIVDRAAKMGISPEEIPAMGNRFMDEGLVPTGLNPFRNPLEQTKAAAAALQRRSGAEIGEVLGAQDARTPIGPLLPGVERMDYAQAAKDAARPLRGITAAEEDVSGKANRLVNQVGRQQDITPGSASGLNRLKSKAYRGVDWQNEAPLAAELHRDATGGLKRSIEDQIGDRLGPDARDTLINANSRYGLGADAEELATRATSRDVQKQQFSPLRAAISSALGAGGGAAASGPGGAGVGAVVGPYLTNAILTRGPNVAAHANRALASAVPAVSPALTRAMAYFGANPDLAKSLTGGDAPPAEHQKVQPREARPQGRPSTAAPRRVDSSPDMNALRAIRDRSSVEVNALDPTITSRTPASVDVEALQPTNMVTVPKSAEEEDMERRLERRMKLARFFAGDSGFGDELQLQR